jgi:RNA polymerase sigma factor (sigma-70 family)
MAEHHSSDRELLPGLRTGDEQAFRALMEKYQDRLYNLCLSMLGMKEEAEDLTQEIFLEICRSVLKFREEASLNTWIYRIAIRKCQEHVRYRSREKRGGGVKKMLTWDEVQQNEMPLAVDHPGFAVEQLEEAAWLYHCLDQLKERQRTALVMHQLEGYKHEEISEFMGASVSSIESLIHRGKKQLRELLIKQRPFYYQFSDQHEKDEQE